MRFPHHFLGGAAARATRLRDDARGVAAIEFALILPFMLLMYFGSAEITKAILVNRKVTIATRSISDLLAQKIKPIDDAQASDMFNSALYIMGADSTGIKMTMSSINFVLQNGSTTNYDAKTAWSVAQNGNGLRPCGILTKDNSAAAEPDLTKVPAGFYGPGTIVVADVTYVYPSPFKISTFFYSSPPTMTFKRAHFNTPRNVASIGFAGTTATICP